MYICVHACICICIYMRMSLQCAVSLHTQDVFIVCACAHARVAMAIDGQLMATAECAVLVLIEMLQLLISEPIYVRVIVEVRHRYGAEP